ncbi:hypothetical protein AAFF_G00085410 [Aldrovandia affinis]|uniref:Protein NDNF n=1 Tax=Aldrovandia affinis TaxID=143900 RepID=A0AAD7WDB4_9TELE|nr:hypothetical protein AAFF_G00085410 [Aldrovandia affinis]
MALPWGHCLMVAVLCGPVWALGPENEVPLRPTSWLPDSQLTPIHLPKDRTRRLYFTLRTRSPAMTLTVSPCDVPIEWSLSARTLKDKASKSLHWSSKKSTPEVWWRGPGTEAKMHAYTGDAVDTFRGPGYAQASVYILKLKSRGRDTRATVYLQEGSWAPGGGVPRAAPRPARPHGGGGHDQCHPQLGAQRLRPDAPTGRPRLPVLRAGEPRAQLPERVRRPRGHGEGEEEEGEEGEGAAGDGVADTQGVVVAAVGLLRGGEGPAVETDADTAEPRCACRGTESVCTVSELTPDTLYYFDVFVTGAANGTGAAYAGTSARTHEEARPAVTPLGEGERRWAALQGGGGRLFSFRPRGWRQSALLTLQSCGGRGRQGHRLQQGADAGVPAGGPGGDAGVAAGEALAPPALPRTLHIKSFSKLRRCSSVTLAWLGTEERSLYCVYRRRLAGEGEEGGPGGVADDDRCLGPESRPETERVLCKYFQELNPRRAVTTATVEGLEPGGAYVFDVYLMRRWGIPIKYHSKTVRTRKDC